MHWIFIIKTLSLVLNQRQDVHLTGLELRETVPNFVSLVF